MDCDFIAGGCFDVVYDTECTRDDICGDVLDGKKCIVKTWVAF
jgi:hypothetical protein